MLTRLSANNTGSFNSFFGDSAGRATTTAIDNSFVGFESGFSNALGDANSFFGRGAGHSNVTGDRNSFFGSGAGFNNTVSGNSFFGTNAGLSNNTGSGNSIFGDCAGGAASGNQFGLDFYTNFFNRMSITNGGNVGIGTTNPLERLVVEGDTRISGKLTVSTLSAATALHLCTDLCKPKRIDTNGVSHLTNQLLANAVRACDSVSDANSESLNDSTIMRVSCSLPALSIYIRRRPGDRDRQVSSKCRSLPAVA